MPKCLPFEYTQSLTTVVKIVGRSVKQKDQIQAYIKARSKLGCSLTQRMIELSTAYGLSCVSYEVAAGKNVIKSPSGIHQNQVGQKPHFVKKSLQK